MSRSKPSSKRAVLIGAGGWAREHWIDIVLPDFRNKIELVGLVDINRKVLEESGKKLGLSKESLFTSVEKAFDQLKPHFCIVVVTPSAHKKVYMSAIKRGIHILSEKPITDKLKDTLEVYKVVKKSRIKMAITQNYRYESPILTLKSVLKSNRLGRIDYIIVRYASDYRKPRSWDVGAVYEMDNPLLLEGSIHHFDMIRNLSDSNCKQIKSINWNPEWSPFKGNSNSLSLMEMENGVKAFYEGSSNASGQINRWHEEYYRIECEKGSVVVDRGDRVVRVYTRDGRWKQKVVEIPPRPSRLSGHHHIFDNFLKWLDGGIPPETNIHDNIQSALMVFASIDANKTKSTKKIKDYLSK